VILFKLHKRRKATKTKFAIMSLRLFKRNLLRLFSELAAKPDQWSVQRDGEKIHCSVHFDNALLTLPMQLVLVRICFQIY
jgi:hypothetical protein